MTEATGLENKANTGDPNVLIGELMATFAEFKRDNEARLKEIEKRGAADVLTEDKVSRLNAALDSAKAAIDKATLERARPRLEAGGLLAGAPGSDDHEYKEAFAAYVKRGEEKALS